MLRLLLRLTVASGVLAALCWAGTHYFLADWATQAFLPKLLRLCVVICVGAAAFFICATALGITELREITHAVKRRLLRRV
jgi:peptidoglycan biosynthesis protein MviN/MurJ (putative lipid II flippase)